MVLPVPPRTGSEHMCKTGWLTSDWITSKPLKKQNWSQLVD